MNARELLTLMVRTDRGDMNVYSEIEVRAALDAHRAEVLREAATEKVTPTGEATPDFFQPGRSYTYEASGFTAPELIVYFRPEHITRHPERGHLRAIGWSRTGEPGAKWHGDFYDEFDGWAAVAEGGDAR
jgi:hypothetical protein